MYLSELWTPLFFTISYHVMWWSCAWRSEFTLVVILRNGRQTKKETNRRNETIVRNVIHFESRQPQTPSINTTLRRYPPVKRQCLTRCTASRGIRKMTIDDYLISICAFLYRFDTSTQSTTLGFTWLYTQFGSGGKACPERSPKTLILLKWQNFELGHGLPENPDKI